MSRAWMFVEDDPDIYEILSVLFELWGHDVIAFTTGEEALDWLQEVEQGKFTDGLPELAVIDLRLPGDIDGVEICKQLRQNQHLQKIPVIIATAFALSSKQSQEIMADTQANLLLHKPLPSAAKFHQMLNKLVGE